MNEKCGIRLFVNNDSEKERNLKAGGWIKRKKNNEGKPIKIFKVHCVTFLCYYFFAPIHTQTGWNTFFYALFSKSFRFQVELKRKNFFFLRENEGTLKLSAFFPFLYCVVKFSLYAFWLSGNLLEVFKEGDKGEEIYVSRLHFLFLRY